MQMLQRLIVPTYGEKNPGRHGRHAVAATGATGLIIALRGENIPALQAVQRPTRGSADGLHSVPGRHDSGPFSRRLSSLSDTGVFAAADAAADATHRGIRDAS